MNCWPLPGNDFIPKKKRDTDIGWDVFLPSAQSISFGDFLFIPLKLIVKPPDGFYFQLHLRSSVPLNYGLCIPNGVGVIDPSYCGPNDELGLMVYKFGYGKLDKEGKSLLVPGERICQLLLFPIPPRVFFETGKNFYAESRGGFGSTGI